MRILYLAQLIPYPLDAGPKTRMYYVLRYLANAGHDVTLLAFSRPSDSSESVEHLRSFCTDVHTVPMVRSRTRDAYHLARSFTRGLPFLIARDDAADMRKMATSLVQANSYDAIHADQLWMAPYALSAAAAAASRPKLVLDQHNAMFLIPERLAESSTGIQRTLLKREARLMRQFEQDIGQQFDDVVWVTAEDQSAVDLVARPDRRPSEHVIPICIDPDEEGVVDRVPAPHRITFLGGLHWPPNASGVTWFAQEVWPLVQAQCPGARLTIIGKDPPAELATLDATEITGYVKDVTPYLRETAVFIVPLLAGGGMRVKVLNAWSWGLPIVSTTIGGEGIRYAHGEDLLIADDAKEFSVAVTRIWHDRRLSGSLVRSGRHTVELSYDWQKIYRCWNDIFKPEAPIQQSATQNR